MALSEPQRVRLLQELRDFHDLLMTYSDLVQAERAGSPTDMDEMRKLGLDLQRKYGSLREVIREYGGPGIVLLQGGKYECDVFVDMFSYRTFSREAIYAVMNTAIATVGMAMGKMENPDLFETLDDSSPSVQQPRVFIAHGGQCEALVKLKEFLRALGVDPLVVEEQPSGSRSVDNNVEHYLGQANCVVILATKGDIDGRTGDFLPRGNILVEVGRCQERFPKKIIWLLEENTNFPSNVSDKVWERFSQHNMERAFIKVAMELKAFGIVRTGKTRK